MNTSAIQKKSSQPNDRKKNLVWFVLAAFLLLHIALILIYFPVHSVTSGAPLSSGDLHFHFASAAEGYSIFSKHPQIWAYSPHYMAGYPFGLWGSMSRRGYEIIPALIPGVSFEVAFYILIVVLAFLTPLIVALAFKILGYNWRETALCAILSILVYQLDHSFFWNMGGLMFPFAASLAIFYTALLHQGIQLKNLAYLILAGIILGAILWLHPLVLFILIIGTLLVLWTNRQIIFKGPLWMPLITFVIGFLIILPWAILLFQFIDLKRTVLTSALTVGVKDLIMDIFSDRRYLLPFDRRTLEHAVWILAFLGAFSADPKKKPALFIFLGTFLGLFIISYCFCFFSLLSQLEPYHYFTSSIMFAIVPATSGMLKFKELYQKTDRSGKTIFLCLMLILAPCFTAYLIDFTEIHTVNSVVPERKNVIHFLNSQKNIPGRILCNDDAFSTVIQYFTGREIIGGPLGKWSMMPHSFSNIYENTAFGRPIEKISPREWEQYLSLFNIAFVVTASDDLIAKMKSVPEMIKETIEFGKIKVLEINPDRLSWVWGMPSKALVTAEPNHIVVMDPPGGSFILKYHYFKTLVSDPDVKIYPVAVLDDPVPFIGINNEKVQPQINIYNKK